MPDQPSELKVFFGCAIMAIGVLVIVLSGSCVGLLALLEPVRQQPIWSMAELVLFVGILLIFAGNALRRRAKPPPQDETTRDTHD